ncbi:hypothetical protein PIB30_033206 [Stylosanthes scabra]|uniref:Disease resistance protein At4g27190-like leucine-rich repeats domain-containing protein n=1 Tax=Stylosanthes scabra TaxID=79078 RepID=A0ABU6SCP6_9FABA|nr:hypothetical protein [Stylosanthes scabra]
MSKLEHLEIDSKGAKWLMSNIGKYRINSLKHLRLNYSWQSEDENLYSFLHTIPNLQILKVSFWGIREFVPSGNNAPKQRLGSVLLVKEFTLEWCYELEDIGFERDPALQRSLHRLVLNSCDKLIRLAHSSVSFTHLTYLQVSFCRELKTLVTCSTAKSLVHLTTIKVSHCDKLNEIVTNDEGSDKEIKIVFAKLITIEFEGLRNLTSFCSHRCCEFSVPLLEKLILKGCPNMKTFTAKLITTPKLPSVLVGERDEEKRYWEGDLDAPMLPSVLVGERDEEKRYWEGDLNATVQMVFADKVDLELSKYPELKQVWCDQTLGQVNRFQNVKSLVVKRCDYLVHVIPSHLLHCFKNLENLKVSDCDGVQVIFNMEGNSNKMTKAMAISRLKTLSLENLPNLEHVWNTNPKGIIHFEALQSLSVDRCDSLEYVFPSSMAKDLALLNNLSIKNCEKVVKIFAEDKTISELEDTAIMIVFDSLSTLYLMGVPLLKYFYPGQHNLQFPKLTTLNIEAYKWMILNCQEAETFVDQQIIVPLEQVNLLFHGLEKLSFYMKGAMLTWELKSRILEFGYSSQEVLFEEKLKPDYIELLSRLKGLRILSLFRLKSIGLENSWIHPILDIIQTLEVKWCYDIKNLVPSKVSFSSLTKLVVHYCSGLLYLFTSSTAESLTQLKEMIISNCLSMQEIISKEDDESKESNESIIFEQLEILHLEGLPMLRWFYSGKRTLRFPSLQELTMFKIWRMTTFCPHIHINLDSVKLRSGRSYKAYAVQWEDNVDTTIRKMKDKIVRLLSF